jgi:hypothetical protein
VFYLSAIWWHAHARSHVASAWPGLAVRSESSEQGHGSYVTSVLEAVDKFYADVVQRIKSWAPVPPKVKEDEAGPLTGGHARRPPGKARLACHRVR